MIKVANKKMIHKLTFRCFKSNKIRNIIAILAIILTTILFTSIFTVAISMNYSIEQQYMRMVGGYAHGGFKHLSEKQVEQLKNHSLIKEYGTTLMLSMPTEIPFNKHQTEIRYGDDTGAKMFYSIPTTGRMPRDTMELATDTTVLDILGIPYKIGEKVTLTYPLGEKTITDTFTLCGFWQTDEASQASQVWLSKEYVKEKLVGYQPTREDYQLIGTWSLDLMFSDSKNMEDNLSTIAKDNGYNIEDETAHNYIETGVNWAYTSTRIEDGSSISMILAIVILILLVVFTGYLIIYNIFKISVANDIRFYGLLKTIGTTPKQIKRIVRNQAVLLSGIGIPLGLILGFAIGNRITPVIMNVMTIKSTFVTFNPWIFVGAAVFSLITVAISLRKPGKMAARVSPIEAVRYTEGNSSKKKIKNSMGGAKVFKMALENLKLNTNKTVLVIISLSLSVVLLNTTYTFTKGFNMDKFLEKFVVTDFIVGSADYFQFRFGGESQKVTDSFMEEIHAQGGITESGRIYGKTFISTFLMDESMYRQYYGWYPQEALEAGLNNKDENGMIESHVKLYGLEDFPMNQLTTLEGTLDIEKMKSGHYLAQVVFADDYGNPDMEDAIYKVGDKINVHYCTDYKYNEDGYLKENNGWDVEYEIIATVLMPHIMSTRSYGSPQFVMSGDVFIEDTQTSNTMIYMFNVENQNSMDKMDSFIKDYTKTVEPDMDYESKESMEKEFIAMKNMFLMVGGVLSFIVGMVGILNFINAELTSIMTRRREFAMLQSIGMTGKQLKKMLVYEGLFYGIISTVVSIAVSTLLGVAAIKPLESILWFFSFRFTIMPIVLLLPVFLLLGTFIPLVAYKTTNKKSIVERLREVE